LGFGEEFAVAEAGPAGVRNGCDGMIRQVLREAVIDALVKKNPTLWQGTVPWSPPEIRSLVLS
jgi:hypothetical protein